ncbi:uncharacterized protein TNCV_4491051 [Trichonephila clavipes]|nr:uncharacterized protein TNCV_4491051 [Trichonephila clavipes]
MAPGSHCMSGNTFEFRMSWTYHWSLMVPRINARADRAFSISLQSNFLVRGSTSSGGVDVLASRAAHVMGATIPNVLQTGAFVWFKNAQGRIMKVLPVPGWRPMNQLAVRVHFLRCSGLRND